MGLLVISGCEASDMSTMRISVSSEETDIKTTIHVTFDGRCGVFLTSLEEVRKFKEKIRFRLDKLTEIEEKMAMKEKIKSLEKENE